MPRPKKTPTPTSVTVTFPPLEIERIAVVKTFLNSMTNFMDAVGEIEVSEVRLIQVKTSRKDLAVVLKRVAEAEKKKLEGGSKEAGDGRAGS